MGSRILLVFSKFFNREKISKETRKFRRTYFSRKIRHFSRIFVRRVRYPPSVKSGMKHINQLRKKRHLRPIKIDNRALKLGYARLKDMERYHYFAHENPNTGAGPSQLVPKFGFRVNESVVENLYMGSNNIHAAVDGWMHSPGHKENMMEKLTGGAVVSYKGKSIFIGVLKAENGWYYR